MAGSEEEPRAIDVVRQAGAVGEEPRAKDLVRKGEVDERTRPGERTVQRVGDRRDKRPVGNSLRFWKGIGDDDPFLPKKKKDKPVHRAVYVGGRFKQIDKHEKKSEKAADPLARFRSVAPTKPGVRALPQKVAPPKKKAPSPVEVARKKAEAAAKAAPDAEPVETVRAMPPLPSRKAPKGTTASGRMRPGGRVRVGKTRPVVSSSGEAPGGVIPIVPQREPTLDERRHKMATRSRKVQTFSANPALQSPPDAPAAAIEPPRAAKPPPPAKSSKEAKAAETARAIALARSIQPPRPDQSEQPAPQPRAPKPQSPKPESPKPRSPKPRPSPPKPTQAVAPTPAPPKAPPKAAPKPVERSLPKPGGGGMDDLFGGGETRVRIARRTKTSTPVEKPAADDGPKIDRRPPKFDVDPKKK